MSRFLNILATITIFSCIIQGNALASAEKPSMPLMPRIGTDNKVEIPSQVVPQKNVKAVEGKIVKTTAKKEISSDIDMKKIAEEIQAEMDEDKDATLADLRILWESSVQRSETIRFAILKLSNPSGDKEKKSIAKKILSPLASVAPLVGAGTGNAVTGGSAILGGGLLSSLLSDDSAINAHLSKVTDADLVILAQEVDNLQQKLVTLYFNYLSSVERLNMVDRMVNNRYKYYEAAQKSSKDNLSVADVFYRDTLNTQYSARQEVLSARAALEQFAGNEAIIEVDKNIRERLSKSS